MATEGERVVDVLARHAGGMSEPQGTLQGPSHCINYEASSEINSVGFADRAGFGLGVQYAQEAEAMADLERAAVRGSELISMLYTYRSIARALPAVSGSESHKQAMYSTTFEVLHPYMGRITQLMDFKNDLVGKFCTNLELLVRVEANKKSELGSIPCEGLMMQLLRALDMLVVMDSLKDTKARQRLTDDFTAYKSALQHCRADFPNADTIELETNRLEPFLASHFDMMTHLQSSVEKVAGYDLVLASMANFCLECLEQEWYLLPAEKYRLLRSAAYLLWLLDAKGGVNVFKHKLIKKERFAKYFKRNPVVPLYGDMHAHLSAVLKRCPNFSTVQPTEWISVSKKDQEQVQQGHDIVSYLPRVRVRVAEYIGALNELLHRVAAMGGGEKCRLDRDQQTELAMRLTWCVLRGCRLMSLANAQLQEFISWKCANVVSLEDLERRAGVKAEEATDYERALRYNLSDHERTSMVELLWLLKGLHSALCQAEGDPEILIRRALHEQTQHFVHSVMGTTTRKAVKHDRKMLKQSLMQLRHMVADWTDGISIMDEKVIAGKEFKLQDHSRDYPARSVPPSDTQLWLMRATVRAMYDKQSPYIKSHGFSAPDISKETVKEMRAFYSTTALFPYLLRLPETLATLSNVSYLWLREFYLELGQRTQFPISMSLPWILTEHVLDQRNGPLMPMLLASMEPYNDAATDALRVHRQQFLFAEVEAEVNLCFDQVLFLLAEQVYTHYKTRAALMTSGGARAPGSVDGEGDKQAARALGKSWYETLLSQRCVSLLGRRVDLAQLLGQRMNAMLRQSIETAVARFESRDVTAVLELRALLRTAQLTHTLLDKTLPDIDPFEQIFMEANHQMTFLSFSSRIATHVLKEVLEDLLPNFAFRLGDHLFQRPPKTEFTEPPERDAAPKVTQQSHLFGTKQLNAEFAMRSAMMQGQFNTAHAEALVEVLGEGGMQQLLSGLSGHVEDLLNVVGSYVSAVQEAMPANTRTPSHQYGTAGCYGFYEAKLHDLRAYEELHSGVMHNCRRLGNAVLFLELLEGATQLVSTKTLLQLPPSGAEGTEVARPLCEAADSVARAWGQEPAESDMSLMARQLSAVCAPLAPSASLLNGVLARLARALAPQKQQWLGGDGPDTDMATYESTLAFHRVWSAVQFLFCTAARSQRGAQPPTRPPFAPEAHPRARGCPLEPRERGSRALATRPPGRGAVVALLHLAYGVVDDDSTLSPPIATPGTANVETPMGNLNNLVFFGEGVSVAGCLILHMLGQRHRFRLFDFCAHVCSVAETSGSAPTDPTMQAFLSSAADVNRANEQAFTLLEALDVPTVYNVS